MKRTALLTGLVAVMMVAGVASTATIDTFKYGGGTLTAEDGTPTDSMIETSLSGVVGGIRESSVTRTGGGNTVTLGINTTTSFAVDYASGPSTQGTFSLKYGSQATGGSNLNLNISSDNYIRIQFYGGAGPESNMQIRLDIDSSAGSGANKTYDILANTEMVLLDLSEISPLNTGDVDGISISFLNMENADDFTFLFIDSVVPEPATMSLLALGGIAMLKRHKRKQ